MFKHKSVLLKGGTVPSVMAAHHGGRQGTPSVVLLRPSWTTGRQGAANGIAQAWRNPSSRVDSCHYVIDEAQVIRCVPDNIGAYSTAYGSQGMVSINVCYNPPIAPLEIIVQRSAQQAARLCKLYRIPVRILSEAEEERWMVHKWRSRGGIILKTVGDFPADEFLGHVLEYYETF